jgi:glycolate oxidase
MSKDHNEVKRALEEIVGPEYVSDDPAVLESYSKTSRPDIILNIIRPEFVILPGSADEVEAIIKIANRFKKPFVSGGQMYQSSFTPSKEGFITIDMKRMNRILEINEKDMYAVVEPTVTFAELNAEAQKRGLFVRTPYAGAVASVIGNHLYLGFAGVDWRFGIAPQNILAVEWILPTGEKIKLGSLGLPGARWIWGEGPGPDLRGLLRGLLGVSCGLGIVTKMAVKLYPWPRQRDFTELFKGPIPSCKNAWYGGWKKEFHPPRDRFRTFLIAYRDIKSLIEAIRMIGEAEIATVCQHFSAWFLCFEAAQSQEEHWREWKTGYYQTLGDIFGPGVTAYPLIVHIVGFTSPKQVNYEERILKEIVEETGGKFLSEDSKAYYNWVTCGKAADFWRSAISRGSRPKGAFAPIRHPYDSLNFIAKVYDYIDEWFRNQLIQNGLPPDTNASIMAYNFGHIAHLEVHFMFDQSNPDEVAIASKLIKLGFHDDIEKGIYPLGIPPPAHKVLGPLLHNYHILLAKIKKLLDPNGVSNPPHPIMPEEYIT